jgi:hypothetical protein
VEKCNNLSGYPDVQVSTKVKNFKQHLKEWNKNVFGNIFQAQRDLEQ